MEEKKEKDTLGMKVKENAEKKRRQRRQERDRIIQLTSSTSSSLRLPILLGKAPLDKVGGDLRVDRDSH